MLSITQVLAKSALLAWPLLGVVASDTIPDQVRSLPSVDLERYAGVWHEVARFPNRFQTQCLGDVTATYTLLPSEQIEVVNACRVEGGERTRAVGRARLARRGGPTSQLKVRFAPAILSFLPMVWGDYWILDITPEYGAALVGDPSRKYLWVLSRSKQIDPADYARLLESASAQGFDVTRLEQTP